jgi:hypothetical protein
LVTEQYEHWVNESDEELVADDPHELESFQRLKVNIFCMTELVVHVDILFLPFLFSLTCKLYFCVLLQFSKY